MVKRSGTRRGQLLLFLALLFGITTMHTVGHPASGHSGPGPSATAHAAPAGHGTGPAAHGTDRAAPPVVQDAAPEPGVMDPTLVCLAVLGAFGLALLVAAAAWLRRRAGHVAARLRSVSAALPETRAGPPPERIRLAQLSVLRI
ncbi:DUF6153 family protein [Streptomyces sp. NPDC047315]|uniref:DUF6153 family protein n=1 Tax=Streptomyces sp. NPDC047315 TaxID=3155142 RepID=UPI0033D08F28